jgi:hypothetical protein
MNDPEIEFKFYKHCIENEARKILSINERINWFKSLKKSLLKEIDDADKTVSDRQNDMRQMQSLNTAELDFKKIFFIKEEKFHYSRNLFILNMIDLFLKDKIEELENNIDRTLIESNESGYEGIKKEINKIDSRSNLEYFDKTNDTGKYTLVNNLKVNAFAKCIWENRKELGLSDKCSVIRDVIIQKFDLVPKPFYNRLNESMNDKNKSQYPPELCDQLNKILINKEH